MNAINPTSGMDKKRILNLEKGYALDEIWSEFNINKYGIHKQL